MHHLLLAARYRACIRSAHLITGCALSRLHSLRSSFDSLTSDLTPAPVYTSIQYENTPILNENRHTQNRSAKEPYASVMLRSGFALQVLTAPAGFSGRLAGRLARRLPSKAAWMRMKRFFYQNCPGMAVLLAALTVLAAGCSYTPQQPIEYSHAVHAGKFQMECLHCHFNAERSRHAGVPPAQTCMNCHSQVKRDSPEIVKISEALKAGTPIEWVRVHRFPDHAFFDHSRHVKVAEIRCQQCHGPVETMTRVYQVENMTMGFCLDCHRQTDASKDGFKPSIDCAGCH